MCIKQSYLRDSYSCSMSWRLYSKSLSASSRQAFLFLQSRTTIVNKTSRHTKQLEELNHRLTTPIPDASLRSLARKCAGHVWNRMLTYAEVGWRMLTCTDECWCMMPYDKPLLSFYLIFSGSSYFASCDLTTVTNTWRMCGWRNRWLKRQRKQGRLWRSSDAWRCNACSCPASFVPTPAPHCPHLYLNT